jgi:hypothetical protein
MWHAMCFVHPLINVVVLCLIVFNATFNNISVLSWCSVLFVEDPEKTTDLSQVTDKPFDQNFVFLGRLY